MNEHEEQKEEKLELVFGTEKLLESAKEPFVGEVIYAEYPCHCEDCEKGATALLQEYQREAPERLHIKMKPLTVYTEVQHQWWIPTKTKLSRWGALQAQLEKLDELGQTGLMDKFRTERHNAFMGLVAEWQWSEVAVGVTGDTKSHWLPVRILTADETNALKAGKPVEGITGSTSEEGTAGGTSEETTGEGATKLD